MALRPYSKDWLEELCKDSFSLAEVLKKAGRQQGGGAQQTLKKKIAEWNIDVSHFTGQAWSKGKNAKTDPRIHTKERYNVEDIFVENSPYERKIARGYILRHHLLDYKCEICGNEGIWQGQTLTLQLDHKNGINNDHRLENLRWLCPNCHAITETFAGKNNKDEITQEEVDLAIQEVGPLSAKDLATYLGRSVNGGTINKIKLLALQLGYTI